MHVYIHMPKVKQNTLYNKVQGTHFIREIYIKYEILFIAMDYNIFFYIQYDINYTKANCYGKYQIFHIYLGFESI